MKIPTMGNKSLIDKNDKNKKMNKLEKIYNKVKEKGDIEKTSIICSNLFIQNDYNFRVFISISISIMAAYDPYNNESLVMTLIVEKNGQIEKWLEMKKSSLIAGGLEFMLLMIFQQKSLLLCI
jgi:hypothetical protein